MDTTIPYLRTQTELLTEMKVKARLGSTGRWTDAEYYSALNDILYTWADHVKLPRVYTITDGFQASEFGYDLPVYIRPPIIAQLSRRKPYYEYQIESTTSTWQEAPGYAVEPNDSGGLTLRLFSPPRSVEARVLYFAPNSRVPLTLPVTSGSTSSTATSVLLSTVVDCDEVGTIKINSELMHYSGKDVTTSTTTLNNLVRALSGTVAATHDTGSTVTWCIGMDTMSLQSLLFNQWRSAMAQYYIMDGGTHEISRYEKALGYYDQQAANYFATYKPQRPKPGLGLNQKAFGLR
jgi:hypothetical protein